MIRLADEYFGARNDPSQISVNQRVMNRLKRIHPGTMTEKRTGKGPVAWILIIPTTQKLMKQFIKKEIDESELLKKNTFAYQIRRNLSMFGACSPGISK
jgi:hypothetical protein